MSYKNTNCSLFSSNCMEPRVSYGVHVTHISTFLSLVFGFVYLRPVFVWPMLPMYLYCVANVTDVFILSARFYLTFMSQLQKNNCDVVFIQCLMTNVAYPFMIVSTVLYYYYFVLMFPIDRDKSLYLVLQSRKWLKGIHVVLTQ